MVPSEPLPPADLDAWRRWVVVELVPGLVHHLNNAQAGVLAAVDLIARGPRGADAPLAELQSAAARDARLLEELGRLAKGTSAAGSGDLAQALRRARGLVDLAAARAGATVEWEVPPRPVPVSVDESFLAGLTTAVAVTALGGRGRGRLRVLARPGRPGTATLSVAVSGCPGAEARGAGYPGPWLESVGRLLADEVAGGVRAREGRASAAWRLSLPLAEGATAWDREAAARPAATALLVHLAEPTLAELVRTVLVEAGYEVERADSLEGLLAAARSGTFALALVDARAAAGRADEVPAGPRTAWVGRAPEGRSEPALAVPFRPGELLEFVRGALDAGAPR